MARRHSSPATRSVLQSICNPLLSKPSSVDVKRDDDGSSSTPGIPNAKGNGTFCVKAGRTTIV